MLIASEPHGRVTSRRRTPYGSSADNGGRARRTQKPNGVSCRKALSGLYLTSSTRVAGDKTSGTVKPKRRRTAKIASPEDSPRPITPIHVTPRKGLPKRRSDPHSTLDQRHRSRCERRCRGAPRLHAPQGRGAPRSVANAFAAIGRADFASARTCGRAVDARPSLQSGPAAPSPMARERRGFGSATAPLTPYRRAAAPAGQPVMSLQARRSS